MLTIRRVFMGVLALALTLTSSYAVDLDGAAVDVEESSSSASHQRRELWDFFDLLMMVGVHPPCGPCFKPGTEHSANPIKADHPPPHCSKFCYDDVSGSGSSASQSQFYAAEDEETLYDSNNTGNAGQGTNAANGFAIWMLFMAGSVMAAMAAVHMGQRKNPKVMKNRHAMAGSVNRRVGAVGAFADGMTPDHATQGVELQEGYHVDVQPDGSFEVDHGVRVV